MTDYVDKATKERLWRDWKETNLTINELVLKHKMGANVIYRISKFEEWGARKSKKPSTESQKKDYKTLKREYTEAPRKMAARFKAGEISRDLPLTFPQRAPHPYNLCKFPVNPDTTNFSFCHRERKDEDSVYCEKHHRICYKSGSRLVKSDLEEIIDWYGLL